MQDLNTLTDELLVVETKSLVASEREVLVKLLHYLNEIERRELYLKLGYSSMYAFATKKLNYSEAQALRRIRTARCIKDLPEIENLLLNGKLNLCVVALAHKELRSDKKQEVLARLTGTSKREAEAILSEDKPEKVIRDSIKPLGRKRTAKKSAKPLPLLENSLTVPGNGKPEAKPQRHHIQFSAGEEFVEKLEEVKSLLSRKFPKGIGLEEALAECMEAYLDKHSPIRRQERRAKRNAKSASKAKANKRSRYVPAGIHDQIFIRDEHRCSYVSDDGVRCECKHNLHVDHRKPFAIGGRSEFDNLRLLCGPHNRMEAKRVFGETYIQSRIGAA